MPNTKAWLPHALLNARETPPPPRHPRHGKAGPIRKTFTFREHGKGIGARLRNARLRDGRNGRGFWSLRSVARRAGINIGLLSQIETGKRRPAADDLVQLADVLGEDREETLVRAGYLPESALENRGSYNLNAAERELIELVRAHRGLIAPLKALLAAMPRR